jgi:hypothetical protein
MDAAVQSVTDGPPAGNATPAASSGNNRVLTATFFMQSPYHTFKTRSYPVFRNQNPGRITVSFAHDIVNRFGGKLALNCDVGSAGEIHVAQEVKIVRAKPSATGD